MQTKLKFLELGAFFFITFIIVFSTLTLLSDRFLHKSATTKQEEKLSQTYNSKQASQDTKPKINERKTSTESAKTEVQEPPTTTTKQTSKQTTNLTNQIDQQSQQNVKQESSPNQSSPPPQPEIYAVQPVIFLASDTNIDLNSYVSQVNNSFQAVRSWYAQQLGGKTFNLIDAVSFRTTKTEAQLAVDYPGGIALWVDGLRSATVTNNLTLCNDHRFYYFVTPINNNVAGGMIGAENLGCSFVLPGTANIPNHMGRLIGGIFDPEWPEWWADEIREAQGGVAHEIGHGLGGSCTVGNFYPGGGCNGLPHSSSPSIMWSWWDFGTTGIFFDSEKTEILKSPFIQ